MRQQRGMSAQESRLSLPDSFSFCRRTQLLLPLLLLLLLPLPCQLFLCFLCLSEAKSKNRK